MNLNYSSYVLAQGDRDFSTFSLFSLNIALWWGRTAPWGEKIRRLFFFFLPPLHSHGFPHIEKLICEQKTSQLQNSVHRKKKTTTKFYVWLASTEILAELAASVAVSRSGQKCHLPTTPSTHAREELGRFNSVGSISVQAAPQFPFPV